MLVQAGDSFAGRVAMQLGAQRWRRRARCAHLIIPTAGGGNIGDQAMLDALIQGANMESVVVVPDSGRFSTQDYDSNRVAVRVIRQLFGRPGPGRLWACYRLGRIIGCSRAVSVIGADIMDGGYSSRESLLRLDILAVGASRGARCAVTGFSWNGHADRRIVRALRSIAPAVRLVARDPHSVTRLNEDGINVVRGSDLAFTLGSESDEAHFDDWRSQTSADYVVLNVSGLLASPHLLAEAQLVLDGLLSRKLRVVVLPHVIRGGDDDLSASIKMLADRRDDSTQVYLVDRLLTPAQVRGVVGGAQLVISGRMHLAILALTTNTEPVVFSSQGKVSGLLQLFDIEHNLVEPKTFSAAALLDRVEEIRAVPTKVGVHLPTVQALARKNFGHLVERGAHA